MHESASARIALTTAGSADEARKLAYALVEGRVAACVNLVPDVMSIYRWQGAIEEASEVLLVIKTTQRQLAAVEAMLRELHSYDVPELLALDVEAGSQPYLDWLLGNVKG